MNVISVTQDSKPVRRLVQSKATLDGGRVSFSLFEEFSPACQVFECTRRF